MEKWQKDRNYRRIKDEDGNVVANVITVDGVTVEVSDEVFLAYSQADRRERYLSERDAAEGLLSTGLLEVGSVPSAEDSCLEREENQTWENWKKMLPEVLKELEPDEQDLIQTLFFRGVSAREYARELGVYHQVVLHRKGKVLKKLRKNLIEKSSIFQIFGREGERNFSIPFIAH